MSCISIIIIHSQHFRLQYIQHVRIIISLNYHLTSPMKHSTSPDHKETVFVCRLTQAYLTFSCIYLLFFICGHELAWKRGLHPTLHSVLPIRKPSRHTNNNHKQESQSISKYVFVSAHYYCIINYYSAVWLYYNTHPSLLLQSAAART